MSDYTGKDLRQIGAKWIDKIRASEKREEDWRADAEAAEAAYLAGQDDSKGPVPDFNIVNSNVETIVPAIYNSTPAPDIRSRHNVEDEISKEVASALERAIALQIDDNRLDGEMEKLAQDAFLAGRGIVRLRFDADVEDIVEEYDDGSEETIGQRVTGELIKYENVSWRDYREGPAKKWEDVPWVAFKHCLSAEEFERLTDDEMYSRQSEDGEVEDADEESDVDVWEIWCRETGRVYFVADEKNRVLKIEDDPLGLTGFFPMPEPVQPITGTGSRKPVCPYAIYRSQAEELDRVTKRINAILKGLKVRGGVAASAEAIEDIARAGDNELVPIADVEGLIATGGIEKAIMWWPIDKAIVVLRELYVAREQIKATIYEITGISDIIRGQGAASETATAQQIKTEWGSLRVKKMQRMIERAVRDVFKISAEIISLHFDLEEVMRSAGIQQPNEAIMAMIGKPLDHYRIDVESDSTVLADTSKRREEMARFLEGTASFFQVMAPLVAQSPQAAAPVAEIYGAFTNQFRLGKQAEASIDQLVELARGLSQKTQENPQAQAQQAEQQAQMAEMQMKQAELQAGQQEKAAELQMKQGESQAKMQLEAIKLEMQRDELALRREEMALKREELARKENLEMAKLAQTREIEMLRLGMKDREGQVVSAEDERNETFTAVLNEVVSAVRGLQEAGNMPRRVIRDENGDVIGVEPVNYQ